MADSLQLNLDSTEDDTKEELYSVRDGMIFIIDATKDMFEPDSDSCYFSQCLKIYQNILSQKLVDNKQDWMGITLCGSEKHDQDLDIKNILTVQKLSPVTIEMMQMIMNISKDCKAYATEIGHSKNFPLRNGLWYASQQFSAVNVTMGMKSVYLMTTQSDPFKGEDAEKHGVRLQAQRFSDINIDFRVIGLGPNWDENVFFKDVELISGKIQGEDYTRLYLQDLELQVKQPSTVMANIPLRLGGVKIPVTLSDLCRKILYSSRMRIDKATNEQLKTVGVFEKGKTEEKKDREEDDEEKGEDEEDSEEILTSDDVQYVQTFGGKDIYFNGKEIKGLGNIRPPGIDLLCFKPLNFNIAYHVDPPNIVQYSTSASESEKMLFVGLLVKCQEKNIMGVCSVTIRKNSAPLFYTMIPDMEHSGFYLYKLASMEQVNDIEAEEAEEWMTNDDDGLPIDEEGVELFEEIIQKTKFIYHQDLFHDPVIQTKLEGIEALALNKEKLRDITDTTIPLVKNMQERLGDLPEQFDKLFGNMEEQSSASSNSGVSRKRKVENCFFNKTKFDSYTVVQLREYLKNKGLATWGKKADLINRIYQNFS
ncbi:X-ray repair cross-complementing protein 6 isoform X1 [Orussus abietinus]|uniref:X-ray repair cross-complementing protein 6 isoform X1 n=1 Tax=Orussus abietinus TaxID=222816 RepID=UPI00062524CD|nr:X-ray repair cross-complementing protein 6 isoform X1 [Orussus abietinus]XP_012270322.1 X-ray repair cross-complementing protein 6 isoform X1 [Orussus abietinus]XP_012270323.1 X-ray repair cross-complementing protein 6 isoform X1 [Orussus abietinus]XP_023289122.1 X-ray repair cross-complementing protein 6 isoform X1 [Orussus abietinus]